VVVLAVVAMLGGHFTELFDRWDHTLRTGKDADYAVVMVAACAGVVLALARKISAVFRGLRIESDCLVEESSSPFALRLTEAAVTGPSPPLLLPLRI